jgi:hypothetical protein
MMNEKMETEKLEARKRDNRLASKFECQRQRIQGIKE